MENDGASVAEELPAPLSFKVHARMCSELLNLVVGVSNIIPEIEAARPRASGMEALCLLNNRIAKAKSLLQHCCESSILYLVLTGDTILSRCKKTRNLVEHSLSQIQNVVPILLAAKISGIILALRSAVFCLDPLEEEAGKALWELLHTYDPKIGSSEDFALSTIHVVCSRLHISSQKALVTEKRSSRKLLDKFGESERSKKKILSFFLSLLDKYIKAKAKGKWGDSSTECKDVLHLESPYNLSGVVELHARRRPRETQADILSRPVPPNEFLCPLSATLMLNPVVIASGQTYERMWIQKWFDEGHDTCPKTNVKLDHLSFTANIVMKDIISKWLATHNFSDANIQDASVKSWETSVNSISSLGSCIENLSLH